MAAATPYVFAPAQHAHLAPYLAALHGSCITGDHMLGTFLPPLNHEKLLRWWKDRIAEVNLGTRMIIILLQESDPGAKAVGTELKGAIMLGMPATETSPHCGLVECLVIRSEYRKQGGATTLITALEVEALQRGKTLLRMETQPGTDAEVVFRKFGYQEVGTIPGYAVDTDKTKKGQVIFYKDLTQ